MPRTIKVAIVGTGLAGLTAAHLLTKDCAEEEVEFEVHLFEKASSVGMDSSSISMSPHTADHEWRIDVPMRSFQGGYYPNLIALYQSLGVKIRQADFSYSFSSLRFPTSDLSNREITTSMIYNGASGRAGVSKPSIFRDAFSKKYKDTIFGFTMELLGTLLFLYTMLQVIVCYLITLYHSLPFWRPKDISDITLRQWASRVTPVSYISKITGMDTAWKDYIQNVFIPLISAVCSAPEDEVLNHPVEELLDYVWLTFGTHHYVVLGGVRTVVAGLTAKLEHLHLSSQIISIKPDPSDEQCITIACLKDDQVEEYPGFRHVIMATQASGAVPILHTYLQALQDKFEHRTIKVTEQIKCLKEFHYLRTMVINHTDKTLLPDCKADIRDLNLITLACDELYPGGNVPLPLCVSPLCTMATHILPNPDDYPATAPTVYQTTNPIIPPQKDSVLSVATLERAVITMQSKKALKSLCVKGSQKWWQCPYQAETRLGELQGAQSDAEAIAPGLWICGSYAHIGIPLLEGCVVSARNVVEQGILKVEGLHWTQEPWAS